MTMMSCSSERGSSSRLLPGLFALPTAEAPAWERGLRPYQVEAVEGVYEQLADFRSTLIVMPTGTGKTTVFGAVAKRWKQGRVLILAHRDELIQQAASRLRNATGQFVDIEQAQQRAAGAHYVVGSVQTLSRPRRLAGFSPDQFGLIVIDEAHHATADSYRRVLNHFSGAKILGVTATPDRADETAMGTVFDSVAYQYGIDEAIADGWLCPLRIQVIEVLGVNLSSVRTTAGDLNAGDLDAIMRTEESIHGVVIPTIESAGNRRTLVFTTSVATAHRMAEAFNRYKPGSARAVDGETPTDERRETLRAHRANEFQYLVNVGVLTEGYDDPGLACIAMARPTKSRALYTQCIGRGLRTYPDKADCLVLDFVGASGRHRLISAVDILGGKFSDAEVKQAKDIAAKEPGKRVDEALIEARRKLVEQERQAEAARRMAARAEVQFRSSEVNPFGVLRMAPPASAPEHGGRPATDKQLEALKGFGVDLPRGVTFEQAKRLLDNVFVRRQKGLASYKQVRVLGKYQVDAVHMKNATAGRVIDAIATNGWKALSREALQAIVRRPRDVGEEG